MYKEIINPPENISCLDIASTALRRCYDTNNHFPIIKATSSGRYSRDFWLRDTVIGGWGALAIGEDQDINIVTGALESIFKNGLKNPYRIKNLPNKKQETFVPFIKRLSNPSLLLSGERPEIADSFLSLSLAGKYLSSEKVDEDKKTEFWWTHKDKILNLWKHYSEKLEQNNGLIHEYPLSSRQDSVLKSGSVLLTNLLFYKTLQDLGDGLKNINHDHSQLLTQSQILKEGINQQFWPETEQNHYLDWITKKGKTHGYCDIMANCWAVILGVTDDEKTKNILDFIGKSVNKNVIGLLGAVEPAYPLKLIDNGLRLLGFPDYFNNKTVYWPEVTILYAAALKKAGRIDESNYSKEIVDGLLKRDKTFYENYNEQGERTKIEFVNFKGKSESLKKITTYRVPSDFAMALGTYLYSLK